MIRSFIGPGPRRLLDRIARLLRSPSSHLHLAIIGSIAAIAVVDSLTPLSLDEWMLYYIPLVLSFALFEPALPIGIAFAATILIVVASVVSPPGLEPRAEAINRGLGVTGLWVTAVVGYLFVRGKHTLREQSAALRAANEQLQAEMKLRAETQAVLDQAQRLEVIGQLAGGLAHDINNMLAVVTAGIELAMRRIEDDKAREFLARARQAVDMGAKLNRQLLTFARRRKLDPVRFNLNQHLAEVSKLLEGSLGAQATLSMELASDPSTVTVDPGEVDNTLLNLVINARDAMPSGGALKIETHDITLDAAASAGIPDAYAGEFFTTKESGKGTGLGLSSVYGFARQSGGFLNITSEVEKGTSVSIFLPRIA